jgi:proteic killer suppression protein
MKLVDDHRSDRYDSRHGQVDQDEHDAPMEIEYRNADLERLEIDDAAAGAYGRGVLKGFRKVINFIRAATDERDFRSMRSLNFEKLKGARAHQYSLRLNNQWRLIIEIRSAVPKNIVVVIDIEDYH